MMLRICQCDRCKKRSEHESGIPQGWYTVRRMENMRIVTDDQHYCHDCMLDVFLEEQNDGSANMITFTKSGEGYAGGGT